MKIGYALPSGSLPCNFVAQNPTWLLGATGFYVARLLHLVAVSTDFLSQPIVVELLGVPESLL